MNRLIKVPVMRRKPTVTYYAEISYAKVLVNSSLTNKVICPELYLSLVRPPGLQLGLGLGLGTPSV